MIGTLFVQVSNAQRSMSLCHLTWRYQWQKSACSDTCGMQASPPPPPKKNDNNNWAGTTLIIKVDDYIWPTRIVMPSGLRLKMFVFFNVNEQLTAIFEIGQRYVLYELSLFLLFTLDYLSEHSHIYTGLILLITQNLPRYFLFTFRLFVWLIQPKYMSHPSH